MKPNVDSSQEILAVARSIKDELDPAALSLSGARLLQLLEPFLESLVPVEVVSVLFPHLDGLF